MNIFYLHQAPEIAASYLHDKHVVKMVLETAQIMSAVYARYGHETEYRPTHQNHPSVLWAGDTVAQYRWLARHGLFLALEYEHRYGRVHASKRIVTSLAKPPDGLYNASWRSPPLCMPPEFHQVDAVAAYREYYLARKVSQSRWTRRAVPEFVKEAVQMAKKNPAKTAAEPTPAASEVIDTTIPTGEVTETTVGSTVEAPADAPSTAPAAEAKIALTKLRGPRGVPETAKITLLVTDNPKRPGSKAHRVFSQYVDSMTVGAFCDAVDASVNDDDGSSNKGAGTPNLVYDAAHGFISIEGYVVPGGVITAKPKAPAAPKVVKEPKAPKTSKVTDAPTAEAPAAATSEAAAAVEEATAEEVLE